MIFKSKNKLSVFDKIVLTFNIISACALLLSYLAPFVSPVSWPAIAILGFGYQVLLLTNILMLAYWLLRRKNHFLISMISIALGFFALTANFGFRFSGAKSGEKASPAGIRMMEYNVHEFFGRVDKYDNDEVHYAKANIVQIIKDKQPDIVNMEEFYSLKADKGAIIDSIKKALKSDYYYFKPFNENKWGPKGTAIFTKFPIVDSGVVATPGIINNLTIFVDVKYQSQIIRIYCVHLAAVKIKDEEKRKYLSGGGLSFSKLLFIESKLKSAFQLRSQQVALIKQHTEQCPYPYIIAGDFNDTPNSYSVNKISKGLKNAFIEKGSGFGITYYSNFPKLHIDYILTSPQFDVLNYETIDKKLSDHKPIISDLRLN